MSLHILEDIHFKLVLSSNNSKLLSTGIGDISLVLFHTPDCEYCGELKETFKILATVLDVRKPLIAK